MPIASKTKSGLAQQVRKHRPKPGPLWQGPCGEGPQGGVTQGLLARYFVCPERFRVHAVEGLRAPEKFAAPLDFGNMWHACEEALAAQPSLINGWCPKMETVLREHAQGLCKKYPLQQDEIAGWHEKCAAMFPLYVKHWSEHPDVKDRTPLLQEQTFDVPYALPSGRTVRLRGKWDAVDLIGKGKDTGVYLQENKSKSSIDDQKIAQQLTFDLQTMLYLIALTEFQRSLKEDERPEADWESVVPNWKKVRGELFDKPIRGVRYNVVRRSAHKSVESMLKKIAEDEENGRIGEWFARWRVDILPADVERFKRTCLDPTLENLYDDYEWWIYCRESGRNQFDFSWREEQFLDHSPRHHITPFGVYNVLAEGGSTDVDSYLRTGSEVGLVRSDDLFPELKQ